MVRGIVTMRVVVHEYWFVVLALMLSAVLIRGALGV
jgi:hypothetical protein